MLANRGHSYKAPLQDARSASRKGAGLNSLSKRGKVMSKLIKSNIYKDRSILTVFLLIIIISITLLHTGLLTAEYEDSYVRNYKSRGYLEGGVVNTIGNIEDIRKIVESDKDVAKSRLCEVILPSDVTYTTDKSDKEKELSSITYYKGFESYNLSNDLKFIDRDDSVEGNKIYLNLYNAYSSGLSVGDKMYIKSEQMGDYDFTVAGIYEDLIEGSSYSYGSAIIDDETYECFEKRSDELALSGKAFTKYVLVSCEFKEGVDNEDGIASVTEALRTKGYMAHGYTYELSEKGYISIIKILSGFLAIFSVVIMTICVIMIIFTVNNNIDRDIINIGALRAVGHTTAQIRLALSLEYLIIGLVGTITGCTLSYAVMPMFDEKILRENSGLVWEKGFYPLITFGILAAMIAVILVVVYISTRKIKNLHPATALRFGLKANSFKKNHLPLGELSGNLNVLLALKSSLQNMGQNIVIFGIVFAVGFMTMYSATLYYNTKVDITMFQRLMQGDAPDAYVNINAETEEEIYEDIDKLQDIEEVSQAYGLTGDTCTIAGYDTSLLYVSKPEYVYCGLYEGDMIKEDNEAVIGKVIADKAGVGIGDEVEVEYNGHKERFLITGFQQAVWGLGERIYITDGGAKRLGVDINHSSLRIRVKDVTPEKVDDVLKEVEDVLGSDIVSTENYLKYNMSNDNMPVFATSIVVVILVVLNIFTILLVIRLLLKTIFIRREREFGIKKAVGFTSGQLRVQLSLSLIPASFIASIAGALFAYFVTDSVFSLIFKGFGIMRAELIMKFSLVILTIIVVTFIIFLFSFIMSGRMKRVSAYKLIQE